MSKILLLEDDLSLVDGLSYSLKKQRYEVDIARTVSEANRLWLENKYDLLLLDVTLPDGTGFDICREVRRLSKVPIIFLTASDEEVSIIMGLDIGGDDYITKPFKLGVLLSRINALLRRTGDYTSAGANLSSGGIVANLSEGRVYKNGQALELTAAEYKLLCYFLCNPGVILNKEIILNRLWDSNGSYVDDNTLAVYIRRLRTKIEADPGNPILLVTVRGMGYKWDAEVDGGHV